MREFIKRLLLSVVIPVLMLAGSLQIALADEAGAASYKVSEGAVFNNPYGSTSQRYKILDQIHSAIDHAPKGSAIRVVTYSIKYKKSADKLIAAHKRGVKVQIITSDHLFDKEDEKKEKVATEQLRRLMKALGTKVVADGSQSFVKICNYGCASQHSYSSVHSKIYMFSTTGKSKRVSMISSSNLSVGHAYAWNDMYKVVGNTDLYNRLLENFYIMAKEPKQADLYQNVEVEPKKLRLYTFPRDTDGLGDDVHYTMLQKVRCTGAAKGYGASGKTTIDVAMFQWTDTRTQVAKKLRELADDGCRVRVITAKDHFGADVLKILTAPQKKKASTIVVKDANAMKNGQEYYMHHKFIAINGYYADPALSDKENRSSKIVFAGSPNLTSTGLRHNNEVMLRVRDDKNHAAYTKQFETIWNKYSKAFKYVDPY